jgi:hypothetical protein
LRPNSGEAHLANAYHLYCAISITIVRALSVLASAAANESFVFELWCIDRRQSRWEDSSRNFERGLFFSSFPSITPLPRRYADRKAVLDRFCDSSATLARAQRSNRTGLARRCEQLCTTVHGSHRRTGFHPGAR